MANPIRVAGTCYVRVDGTILPLAGTVTVSPATLNREGVSGLSGAVGYKETPRIPSIDVEVFTAQGKLDLEATLGITDATVQAELGNGETWILRDAWQAGEPEINAADGTVTLRFEGLGCERT